MLKKKLIILIILISTMNLVAEPAIVLAEDIKVNKAETNKELEELLEYADSIRDVSFIGAENNINARWRNFNILRDIVRDAVNDTELTEKESNSLMVQLKYYIKELQIK